MGRRRDWFEEPDEGGTWLDQLTGEIPQIDERTPPPDPRAGGWGAPDPGRRGAASGGYGAPGGRGGPAPGGPGGGGRGGAGGRGGPAPGDRGPGRPAPGGPGGPGAGSGAPPGWAPRSGWERGGWEPTFPAGPYAQGPSLFEEPPFEEAPEPAPDASEAGRIEMGRTVRLERRRNRRRRLRGIIVFLLLASVVGAVTLQAYRLTAHRPPKVRPGVPVTFTIVPGEGSRAIGAALERAGVVDSAGRFRAVAQERGLDAALKPGTYRLQTAMDVDAVIDILVRGPNLGPQFTIPEGFTVAQIVDRMVATRRFSRAQVVKALSSPELQVPFRPKGVKILEGLLFPQTYAINKDDTAVTVLQQMLDQLQQVTAAYDLRATPMHLSPYQVLIVASMIEREAKVSADRPKIARVIYNRLAKGQRLQVDATVQYALGTSRRLSTKDLAVNSPYNTYLHAGLPPTPIASPGEDSIRAALQPAAGPWLFYVLVSKDGRHAFTASAEEFARLKEEARRKGLL